MRPQFYLGEFLAWALGAAALYTLLAHGMGMHASFALAVTVGTILGGALLFVFLLSRRTSANGRWPRLLLTHAVCGLASLGAVHEWAHWKVGYVMRTFVVTEWAAERIDTKRMGDVLEAEVLAEGAEPGVPKGKGRSLMGRAGMFNTATGRNYRYVDRKNGVEYKITPLFLIPRATAPKGISESRYGLECRILGSYRPSLFAATEATWAFGRKMENRIRASWTAALPECKLPQTEFEPARGKD